MRNIIICISAIIVLIAASCGHPETFRVEGEIEGAPSINLRIVYIGQQGIRSAITASRDGKFSFEGSSARPVLVEIYDNDYRIIGRIVAENGQDINLHLDRQNPYKIKAKGNELSVRWAEWLNTNADKLADASPAARNAIIAKFVTENPSSPLAALLMMTDYDASGSNAATADSLLGLIKDDARLNGITAGLADQLARVSSATSQAPVRPFSYVLTGNRRGVFKPSDALLSMIAICPDGRNNDTITRMLRSVRPYIAPGRLQVIELSTAQDTSAWRRNVMTDSATWTQAWVGGSVSSSALAPLGLPAIPYFIITDSAGHQLWRGSSIQSARSNLIQQIANL